MDLFSCDACNHIFKHVPKEEAEDLKSTTIYKLKDPIATIRQYTKDYDNITDIEFVLPTLVFYDIDLFPSKFYKSDINHYFNQLSLMIFLRRCNLLPIAQINTWSGSIARTRIKCVKDR